MLITIDTVRADRLSSYGYRLPTTPNLDWFAARGVRFERALSPSSSTAPTHASIFTGQLPSDHSIGAFNSQFALDDEWPTLAERLRSHGYKTAAVVSNPLLGRALGLDRGFDHYDDETVGVGRFAAKGRRAQVAVDRALTWLDQQQREPFFLWLHLQDAHGPYAPDPAWICPLEPHPEPPTGELPIGRDPSGYRAIPTYQVWDAVRAVAGYSRRYDCELAGLDAQLGRLLGRVVDDPRLQGALVAVTADHGEAFGEDEFFFAHGHGVGLDQVRVPLILAGPGLPRGGVIEAPVGLTGLFGSLLAFAGIAPTQGESAGLPGLAGVPGGPESSTPVYVESLNQVGVAVGGGFARRDLRPSSDAAFWEGGNPNSGGGYWEPLGEVEWTGFGTEASSAEGRAEAQEQLAAFAERVSQTRTARRGHRRALELTAEQAAALEGLGYAQ